MFYQILLVFFTLTITFAYPVDTLRFRMAPKRSVYQCECDTRVIYNEWGYQINKQCELDEWEELMDLYYTMYDYPICLVSDRLSLSLEYHSNYPSGHYDIEHLPNFFV